ncbi:hypothetical protein GSH10_09345 [Burkholderia pseudomallei]|nr:hypothetical protein [Burkholderia pseudomallei]
MRGPRVRAHDIGCECGHSRRSHSRRGHSRRTRCPRTVRRCMPSARADRKRRASARRALTKPRRASARGPNRTRVRSPRYASSPLLTRGRIPFFHVLPTPPPAHRRPSRSFACIGRCALAAFVGCFVGCFADNSWLRSTAAHEAWRACVAPARGAAACRPDCTSSCSRTAPPFWLTSEYWRPLYCSRSLECRSHRTYF